MFIKLVTFMVLAQTSQITCLKPETLAIPKSQITFGPGEAVRKATVKIMIPVNCKTLQPLIPNTQSQALKYLDLALPLDLKSSISQDCGSIGLGTAAHYSMYRFKVDLVVIRRISYLWKEAKFCKKILSEDSSLDPFACVDNLYDEMRAQFMRREPWDELNGIPPKIPTAEELDERAKNDPKCK